MIAAKTNSIEAVKLIVERKADPNVADQNGYTAVTHGILSDNSDITKILLPITS